MYHFSALARGGFGLRFGRRKAEVHRTSCAPQHRSAVSRIRIVPPYYKKGNPFGFPFL